MKNFAILLIALIGMAAPAVAQVVSVEVLLESPQYLADEPLVAKVRISNSTGQTLRLGDDPDWLTFTIETTEGPYVKGLRNPDVVGGFELESSHTATKRIDLAPCFELNRTGRYKLTATVNVPRFGRSYRSPTKSFYIARGTELWRKTFGLPASATGAPEGEPEIRNYILVQAISGPDNRLYARVTDRGEHNYKVVPLGKLTSFSKPEAQLDKWSNLHVLYQSGARNFSYSMINPEGLLISRETHVYGETRPEMTHNDEGRIVIRGGNRQVTVDDIPPADLAQLALDNPLPPAEEPTVVTNAVPAKKGSTKKASPSVDAKEKKKKSN